ncbi:MAG: carbamate kinase [Proteobacteria bacterium]|nr:carbamate kinase [Pseudomonadota bacterium]
MNKLAVIAIGGNSLIKDRSRIAVKDHYNACLETAHNISELIAQGYKVVLTHGNGPQVGFVLRRCEIARHELPMLPLDSCVSNTQGGIGYLLQLAFDNVFREIGIKKTVATIITQVVVSKDDPAFKNPSKPIGNFMEAREAVLHQREDGWQIIEDSGRGYRRVVPSPMPKEIIEIEAIKALLEKDILVIAVGGGGIPVCKDENGILKGVEAVVDKDYASCLLAKELKADYFVVSTAVEKVSINFKKPGEKKLDSMTVNEAQKYISEGHFAAGSMLPKIKAVIDFVRTTNNIGIITDPENISNAILKKSGTRIIL